MKDFLSMRKNPPCYCVFYTHFIKCITKKTRYEERLKAFKAGSGGDICTVSDEAFALLLLENSWDRWWDLYHKDPATLLPRRGGGGRHQEDGNPVVSNVMTKYTTGGYKYENAGEGSRNKKGWSKEGVLRYNQLYDLVETDRAANQANFMAFLRYHLATDGTNKGPKKPVPPKDPPVKVRHNLFRTSTTKGIEHDFQSPPRLNHGGVRSSYPASQALNPLAAESDDEVDDPFRADVVKSAGV